MTSSYGQQTTQTPKVLTEDLPDSGLNANNENKK